MDPWPLVAVILAIGLIVTLAALDRATRGMRRVRGLVGVGREGDPVYGVERLIERVARLETGLAAARSDRNVLLDGLDVGIVDLDPSLQVTYANPAVHAFVGRVPGTLLGLDVLEAFLDPEVEAIARSAVDQGSAVGEVRFRGTDGPTLIVHARRSSSGGAWLVLADVSELRRLQQIRAEFIDNLSHELRTPLTSVSLLAETLSREADTLGDAVPPRMRDRISKIEVETGHLVQMVTEIMDL